MKTIEQHFTIHPVGQGLFYSGNFQFNFDDNPQKEFTFVFDCGSDKKRNCIEEVNRFRDNEWTAGRPLDLLIISHFHSDHINCIANLLAGRKVKRVIAPFISFSDRLVLSLIYINSPGFNPDDSSLDFTLRFILDPVSTIQEYLNDDGEFIFINSGEDSPFEPLSGSNFSESEPNKETDFGFEISGGTNDLTTSERIELRYFGNAQVKGLIDTSRTLCTIGRIPIVDFLFYRKHLGENEILFYETVYRMFLERFPEIENPRALSTNDLVEILSTEGISRFVSDIFRRAFRQIRGLNVTVGQIKNLNTTSLCLLHFNIPNLYALFSNRRHYNPVRLNTGIYRKIDGTDRIIVEIPFDYGYWNERHFYRRIPNFPYRYPYRFPNTLLTSDGFFLSDADIESLCIRYREYWDKFWLFQIPHHGSNNNIDKALLSRISNFNYLFINHGVRNRHKHPSKEVINDIILTRHSIRLLSINEFTGLKFDLENW